MYLLSYHYLEKQLLPPLKLLFCIFLLQSTRRGFGIETVWEDFLGTIVTFLINTIMDNLMYFLEPLPLPKEGR